MDIMEGMIIESEGTHRDKDVLISLSDEIFKS